METKLGKENVAKRMETTLERKRAEDEKQERIRKRKEQEKWEAEAAGCLSSPTTSEAYEEAVAYHEPEIPFESLRRHSQTQAAQDPLIDSPPAPDSEITSLKAEVVQLREDLDRTKARLKDLGDQRDEAREQQKAAVLRDAQDEVAKLQRVVDRLDDLLEKTKTEKRQLQEQLDFSEDKIDELKNQLRDLRRMQAQEENSLPQSNDAAKAHSPQKVAQQKPRQSSTTKNPGEILFTVKAISHAEKVINRPKKGKVPLVLK
jgi:chromosome segregation ATPase